MLEKIQDTFKDLMSALQTARLYPNWHPQFKKAIDKANLSLQEALSQRQDLVIGIVGEELAFEKEIFFELSKIEKPLIVYLKERGIEKIQFLHGLEREELSKFISFLVTPKEEIKHGVQESLSILGIRNIIAGKIKESPAAPKEEVEKIISYLSVYEDSFNKVTHYIDRVLNGEEVDRFALRLNLTTVMEQLLGHYQDFLNFGSMKRYDSRTFFHTLNVCILSMLFSSKMGFTKEQVLDIGIAGLFHDIGKLYISRKILQKPARLSDEEFTKIKNHVIKGAEILLKYVDSLGILPVVICFEHHLRYNLSGYPKLSFDNKCHLVSLIVSICDVYDALSQRRGYKNDYPPKMIYDLMMKETGTTFEPQLVDKFFKIMGVWPVGSIVVLSDGRVAVVREQNEDDILSPKVEVISPADKKEIIDLKLEGGRNKIERSLNPLTEGKEYLSLI